MNWESKQKMCRLFNDGKQSKAVKFVASILNDMDNQSWEMFFMQVTLTPENIYDDIEYHTLIYDTLKCLNICNTHGVQTQIRCEVYKNIFNDIVTTLNKPLTIEYLISKGFSIGSNTIYSSLYINLDEHNIKFYIEEDKSFWYYKDNIKIVQIKTIQHLFFFIEFLTGQKWKL